MGKILKLNPNIQKKKTYYELIIYLNKKDQNIITTIKLINCLLLIPNKVQIEKSYIIFNKIYYKIIIFDLITFNTLWERILIKSNQLIYVKKLNERKK